MNTFHELVASRKAWIEDTLRPWCQTAPLSELRQAEHEWTDIAGRIGPDNSLWLWAWSRFPDLVCDGLLNVNETRQVRVDLRDGGQAEGFPDARLSQRGQLVLLTGGSAPTELGPYPIDDILSVTASADGSPDSG